MTFRGGDSCLPAVSGFGGWTSGLQTFKVLYLPSPPAGSQNYIRYVKIYVLSLSKMLLNLGYTSCRVPHWKR